MCAVAFLQVCLLNVVVISNTFRKLIPPLLRVPENVGARMHVLVYADLFAYEFIVILSVRTESGCYCLPVEP